MVEVCTRRGADPCNSLIGIGHMTRLGLSRVSVRSSSMWIAILSYLLATSALLDEREVPGPGQL
jgi:hypothetical protein